MRIIAGQWRGRQLIAPAGANTRPTADRVRQALFDMLLHAPWAGRDAVEGAHVLDAFAGTGALGLESLSRGASCSFFFEQDRTALAALRANVQACRAEAQCRIVARDTLRPTVGQACNLVFLDPPYGQDLVPKAVEALRAAGWIAEGALLVVETSQGEVLPSLGHLLAERQHGAARLSFWR